MSAALPPRLATYPVAWPAFRLAPATGAVELAVGEALVAPASRPERVTALLSAMLESVDGAAADAALVTRLSVGTREWLLQQCGATCRPEADWFEATCPGCGTGFDMVLDLAALPVAPVPEGFPEVALPASWGPVAARVPNGAQEVALAQAGLGGVAAMRRLLELCICAPGDAARLAELGDAEIRRLDAALDAATPDCADRVTSPCPACGAAVTARLDPLDFAFPGEGPVLSEVHMLGRSYNWAEAAILALPTRRRRAYVAMNRGAGRGRPGSWA